jgi:enterochelin esterase-like enzyme
MRTATRLRGHVVVAAAALIGFSAIGLWGARAYAENYWNYRGFDPPQDPAYVRIAGTTEKLAIRSSALGGRSKEVYVYLPPGYATSGKRYPVLYLLHGFPGKPLAFLETVQMGVVVDSLTARNVAPPAILVMPFGSSGAFTDKEWADGIGHDEHWTTFVTRDLVRAIDSRYRTIANGSGRAIAGLSEGGYGAINMALHHPTEFSVVESWSGYERPAKLRSIFGPNLQLIAANDPRLLLPHVAPALRRAHTYFWLYTGSDDPLRRQNRAFAEELTHYGVSNRYFEVFGGHNWGLWRKEAEPAYLAAIARLARG